MRTPTAAALLALAVAGCAPPPPAVSASVPPARIATQGYLSAAELERLADAVPAAPLSGSVVDRSDRARSQAMRVLDGNERWLLATAHAEIRPPVGLGHFDCALGLRLSGDEALARTPALNRLMTRLFHDADQVVEQVKARVHRPRPVGDEPDRQPCQRVTEAGRASASYPSGTAAIAGAYGEGFADLVPDRADAVRSLAREIGQSRVICGMHYPSDVAIGAAAGRAVVQAVRDHDDYHADLAAARAEMAAVRATGLTNPGCAAERSALAIPLPQP